MYQELLSAGVYDSVQEYDQLLALAREEYEEELAKEEYEREEYEKEYNK